MIETMGVEGKGLKAQAKGRKAAELPAVSKRGDTDVEGQRLGENPAGPSGSEGKIHNGGKDGRKGAPPPVD